MPAEWDPFRDLKGREATFDKGLLSVRVPKAEAATPRTIEVKTT